MGEKAEHIREFGTCFFEKYAQIVLSTVLGPAFEPLVNRDRPDLQSPAGRAVGIEVTRAMEESKAAGLALMQDIAGLPTGKYVGVNELPYWRMALPMRRILESKVSKAASGFYGHWDNLGLFVFSKDNLSEGEALKAMNYTISLQKNNDIRYNRLFIADIDDLFVCNLDDGLTASSRLARHRLTQAQRRTFFLEAIRKQQGR